MPPRSKGKVQLTAAALAAKDAQDEDTQSTATSSGRKRNMGGYYVPRRNINAVEEKAEEDKCKIIELLNNRCEHETRACLVMLETGELARAYHRKFKDRNKPEEVQWNPKGKWTKMRDLRTSWMEEQLLKIDGAGSWLPVAKSHDKYCVPKLWCYMMHVSRHQRLPEGFHLQGTCEAWCDRLREEHAEDMQILINGMKSSGEIEWPELGVCKIVFDQGEDGKEHPFLMRRWPNPTSKVQLDKRYKDVTKDDWKLSDNWDVALAVLRTTDSFVAKSVTEFAEWRDSLTELEQETELIFAEVRRKYLLQQDQAATNGTPIKARRLSVTPPASSPLPSPTPAESAG